MGQFEAIIGVNFWTALAVLLNTLTVFFVGKKFLFGPVMKMIRDRQQEIDDLYTDANTAKRDAAALQKEYQQKLDAAQQTSEAMVREAVARGQRREEEILAAANDRASAIVSKAAEDAQREKKKVLNDAKDEISIIAVEIAGKVVGYQLSADDQSKLVDRFIDELG